MKNVLFMESSPQLKAVCEPIRKDKDVQFLSATSMSQADAILHDQWVHVLLLRPEPESDLHSLFHETESLKKLQIPAPFVLLVSSQDCTHLSEFSNSSQIIDEQISLPFTEDTIRKAVYQALQWDQPDKSLVAARDDLSDKSNGISAFLKNLKAGLPKEPVLTNKSNLRPNSGLPKLLPSCLPNIIKPAASGGGGKNKLSCLISFGISIRITQIDYHRFVFSGF